MSLFDLGANFISAGRQVAFLAGQRTLNGTSLDENRFWLFVHDNGPGALYQGYLHVLDLVVSRGTGGRPLPGVPACAGPRGEQVEGLDLG